MPENPEPDCCPIQPYEEECEYDEEQRAWYYGLIPHNASFGFLDLAPSILQSNWVCGYIS
jgi:hypothetical protein